ncbi:MAG: ABC transporter permease [Verrucomicrobia bacterium]|nr:ABC transporter permease [Verrucomicrobiota bacterium]
MKQTHWAAAYAILSAFLTLALSSSAEPAAWASPSDINRHTKSLKQFFDGIPDRYPGSAGNLEMERRLAERFAASGLPHGEIKFRAPRLVEGTSTIQMPNGEALPLLPMHPGLFRPGNFTNSALDFDLIYLAPSPGRLAGETNSHHSEQLSNAAGQDLNNTLILQEFSGRVALDFMELGSQGFIFIGTNHYTRREADSKMSLSEVRVPRFFISEGDGSRLKASLAAAGGRLRVHIHSEPSRWENTFLRDLWAFIPGSDPSLERETVLLVAPIDANCIVPQLAEGATPGANLHLLMNLFDQFRANPPARSVMIAAVNARTQAHRGDRLLSWFLLAPTANIEAVRDLLAGNMREQELMVHYYTNLQFTAESTAADEAFLEGLRTLKDNSLGPYVSIKDPLVTLVKKDVNQLRAKQIELERTLSIADPIAREAERERLEVERQKFVRVLGLLNRVPGSASTLSDLRESAPESIDILKGYVDQIVERNRHWAALNRQDLARSQANAECRRILGGRRIVYALSLELDFDSPNMGFCTGDASGWGAVGNWATRFGRNTVDLSQSLPAVAAGKRKNRLIDTLTRVGGIEEGYYFPRDVSGGAASQYQNVEATPAFGMRNVYATYLRTFTPGDTLANLNVANVTELSLFVPEFLRTLLNNRNMTAPSELLPYANKKSGLTTVWTGQISTFQFDEFAANVVPTLPVPNTCVVTRHLLSAQSIDPQGVVALNMSLSDERAQTMIYGLYWDGAKQKILCDAFHYNPDFTAIDYAVDAGDVHDRVKSEIIKLSDLRKTLAMFNCREFPILDRTDPSLTSAFPITVQQYIILSAARESAPRKYGFYGGDCLVSSKFEPFAKSGPFMIFMEPNERVKVVTRRKRVLLNADVEEPEGHGYRDSAELTGGFFDRAARDMARLNAYRIGNMTGVSDELAQDFLNRGDQAIARMDQALADKDYVAYLRARFQALGAQVKAYNQTTSITNDMLKAVVFYMALLLPFCFFLQKLLFKAVRVEAQMGLFAIIFVITFVIFRIIHPAFRISQSPEAMLVAFIMGGLAFFVIRVLQGRFEGEMQLLFQTYSGMDTSEVAYSTAGQQAMLIGVQNMKRRRVRTALTTATIVLVTFTMLSFSSISKKMSPTIIARSKAAPYTGLMFHWPGQTMDTATASVLSQMFAGKANLVWRSWLLSPRQAEGTKTKRLAMHIDCSPQQTSAQLDAILGLSVLENGFLDKIPILNGGRFFSSDDAREVIVTASIADKLGLDTDDVHRSHLTFMGVDYTIVGILDDGRFSTIRDIDGKPLVPVQVKSKARGQEETVAMDEDGGDGDAGVEYVNPAMLLLMPIQTLASVPSPVAAPYSVSIAFADDEPIWPHVEDLLTGTDAKFFVSSRVPFKAGGESARQIDPGIYYMGSGYRTSIGGLSVLIIPLLIASTIILNTMLGSVYERRSEIAVYNAVGLNPNHIGMFFLAEAFVYAVIGSVGGYLIGQLLTLLLTRFHLVTDLNLNFSSLNVVYVILFTVTIVMLSTLYPAHVATKTAIPSGKRKWSLPDHDGQFMRIVFPYIYQQPLLLGIMSYIEQHFARFTEASLGDLIAEPSGKTRSIDDQGRPVYSLRYQVALAPFDLGVTQTVTFTARYDEQVRSFRIFMDVRRESGQDTNWTFTNRPFLEQLRQHLMRWRNLNAEQHAEFVNAGEASFASIKMTEGAAPGAPGRDPKHTEHPHG